MNGTTTKAPFSCRERLLQSGGEKKRGERAVMNLPSTLKCLRHWRVWLNEKREFEIRFAQCAEPPALVVALIEEE
jgi:hypothetical protein